MGLRRFHVNCQVIKQNYYSILLHIFQSTQYDKSMKPANIPAHIKRKKVQIVYEFKIYPPPPCTLRTHQAIERLERHHWYCYGQLWA